MLKRIIIALTLVAIVYVDSVIFCSEAAGQTVVMPPTIDANVALPSSDYVLSRSLAASAAKSFAIPSGVRYIFFSATCANFYANYTTTATVPGDVTDGTASELNPTVRRLVSTITTVSVISPTACVITATLYK